MATMAPRMTKEEAATLFAKAHAAGMEAGEKARPTPMQVVQRENPFDPTSPITKRYAPDPEGVCGFAWVNVRPGGSSFARYLKSRGCSAGYGGGVSYWVRQFDQSYERKLAYAHAFAEILREAGIRAHVESRLD